MSVLMSLIPAIFSKSPRTEAAQAPQTMLGTLSVTSVSADDVSSDDVASVSLDEVEVFESIVTDTLEGVQPARVIANPAASNTGANRFMSISPGKTLV